MNVACWYICTSSFTVSWHLKVPLSVSNMLILWTFFWFFCFFTFLRKFGSEWTLLSFCHSWAPLLFTYSISPLSPVVYTGSKTRQDETRSLIPRWESQVLQHQPQSVCSYRPYVKYISTHVSIGLSTKCSTYVTHIVYIQYSPFYTFFKI